MDRSKERFVDPENAAAAAVVADVRQRQRWLGAFARCPEERLEPLLTQMGRDNRYTVLRAPEAGLMMVRARAGGSGQRFNAGEMTVTRCSIRLEDGTVGHGYVAGRDKARAETIARLDALMQGVASAQAEPIVAALETEIEALAEARQSKSAPTKVEFLTMVRGENA